MFWPGTLCFEGHFYCSARMAASSLVFALRGPTIFISVSEYENSFPQSRQT